jgi:hypothetical protein
MACVPQILILTSAELTKLGRRPLTEQELFQYIGLMLIASLYKDMPLDDLFNGSPESYEFDVSPEICTYMSKNRFKYINRCLTFAKPCETSDERAARGHLWTVQPLVDAFNLCRRTVYIAGAKLVAGESFSPWCGLDQRHNAGCPHIRKELRNPKGVGIGMEIKNCVCGIGEIQLVLELVACADEMHRRLHWCPGGAATALMLRLLSSFASSGRLVVGDSAFASVRTAVALHKIGLYFIGLVKSCTRMYPFKHTQEHPYPARGSHIALTARHDDGVNLRTVAWRDGSTVKSFVSTCGTTVAGVPHKKNRWRRNNNDGTTNYVKVNVPRPKLAVDYFDGARTIDVHNHSRQGL